MIQLRPFDTSKGGSVPNLCLDNVRRGFSIGNKYGSAWIAWQHTQQHADRNIPAGLDVPLYYSYTTTIDGVTENYGHINVRLKNGTVWSDGKIYSSIDDYLAYHYPKFVGWGESINDVNVIQGGNMETVNEGDIDNCYIWWIGRKGNANDYAAWVGKPWKDFVYDALNNRPDVIWKKPPPNPTKAENQVAAIQKIVN